MMAAGHNWGHLEWSVNDKKTNVWEERCALFGWVRLVTGLVEVAGRIKQ